MNVKITVFVNILIDFFLPELLNKRENERMVSSVMTE